jgi:hypothetical protein
MSEGCLAQATEMSVRSGKRSLTIVPPCSRSREKGKEVVPKS